jgi:pentatricopeptide repeat protein
MLEDGRHLHSDVFKVMLKYLTSTALVEEAYDYFKKMIDLGFTPDLWTYRLMHDGLKVSGHLEEARKVEDMMHLVHAEYSG